MKQKQLLSFLVCILMLSSCAAPTDSAHDSGLTLRVYFADAEEIRLLPLDEGIKVQREEDFVENLPRITRRKRSNAKQ